LATTTNITDKSAVDLLASVRENRRLFVSGLPKPTDNHASDLEIRELFKCFQVEAVSKVKWPERESQPKHGWYAFVDLSTAAEAQRAMNQIHGDREMGREPHSQHRQWNTKESPGHYAKKRRTNA
jgi:hypothetical protein